MKANVNLRGNHYKNNQEFSLNIEFDKMLTLTSNCIIFSNKFTNRPVGVFKLSDITFRGAKLDRFEVGFVDSPIKNG
jgi:hypothetical protein